MKSLLGVVTSLLLVVSLTACSPGSSASSGAKPEVFASTDVWGSVAKAVGGDLVTVKSAITSPAQDPHSYEATAEDKLSVSKAALVVVNGGGYDDWATTLAKSGTAPLLDAVQISGLRGATPSGSADHEFNEHVFYSLDAVSKVAARIATELGKADAAHAAAFTANAQAFETKLTGLKQRAAGVAGGRQLSVFATEPVTGYLVQAMGMSDVTPEEYVAQSETEAGPSAKVQAEAIELITSGKVNILVMNGQTQTPLTTSLRQTAQAQRLPVVEADETFPEGVNDYVTWITRTLDNFEKAVKAVA